MKGKRFDAAEKYFREKEVKLRQEALQHKEWFIEVSSVNTQLARENEQLKKENAKLKEKYEKFLQFSNLSEDNLSIHFGFVSRYMELFSRMTKSSEYL